MAETRSGGLRGRFPVALLLAGLCLGLLQARAASGQAARIDTIKPAAAYRGDTVTITGNGFGASNVTIEVGGVKAQVLSANGNTVRFRVPETAPFGVTTVGAVNPGGRAGTISFEVLGKFDGTVDVHTDESRKASALIGPAGGEVSATGADGTVFRLTIPAQALPDSRAITITPVASIGRFPLSGGHLATAQFSPEGLQFLIPARLTIQLPGVVSGPVAGFGYEGSGNNFHLSPVTTAGNVLTFQVRHFSGQGAGTPNPADFAALVTPLMQAVPLPTTIAMELVDILAVWDSMYPGFRTTSTLWQQVLDLVVQSLQLNRSQACSQANTLAASHEPFLARDALAIAVHITGELIFLGELFDPGCLTGALEATINAAGTEALANPKAGALVLLADLSADASSLNLPDLSQSALAKLDAALHVLLQQGRQVCATDFTGGRLLMARRFAFSDAFLTALDAALESDFQAAWASCAFTIQPSPASVLFQGTVPFTATVLDATNPGVTWSLEAPAASNTIDAQTGLFTSASLSGIYRVRATSVEDFTRFAIAEVNVQPPVTITISPTAVTLTAGGTQPFAATVTGAGNTAVTWSQSGGSITAAGLYTAGSTPGVFAVTATSVEDPNKFATAIVTIQGGGAGSVIIRSRSASLRYDAQGQCIVTRLTTCPGADRQAPAGFTDYTDNGSMLTQTLWYSAAEQEAKGISSPSDRYFFLQAQAVNNASLGEEDGVTSIRNSGSTLSFFPNPAGYSDDPPVPASSATAGADFEVLIEVKNRPASYSLLASFFSDSFVFKNQCGHSTLSFQFASESITLGPSIPDAAGAGIVNWNKSGTLQPGFYTLRVHAESESTHAETTSGSDFHTQWGFRLNIEPN